ncbi:MAG: spherulation-specific family 4 protein [Planctomycetota bacterium]
MLQGGLAAVIAVATLTATPISAAADDLGLMVPAYIFPGGTTNLAAYDDLVDAASRIPLTVILNPASGPGTSVEPAYNSIISDIQNAGGQVIGYIPTTFGNRSVVDIVTDAQSYNSFYGNGSFDGFFLDEMSNDAADLSLHQNIYTSLKLIDPSFSIFANPGTEVPEAFFSLTQPTADTIVVFENFASQYPTNDPPSYYDNLDASQLAQIIHTVPTTGDIGATVTSIVDQAVSENTGWLYVTDDILPNPFDTLPGFFDSLVDEIEAINNIPEPTSLALLSLASLTLIGRSRRSSRSKVA